MSPELVLSEDEVKFGQVAVEKVRERCVAFNWETDVPMSQITKLSQKVWHSPQIRAALSQLATEAGLNSEVLVRMVKTRWNTFTMVLARAIEMKEVLSGLCDMHQFNRSQGARLRRYILSEEEWKLLEELYQLLDVSSRFHFAS